ncbi:MAG: hypothetical protein CO094_00110 [Anaerolineae bacterium CG_4_9_14_3_um_filter_57_17]|nr:hypothetical protein [bacterium]NCT21308.1 hypothetical protein [bacterium]OIO84837.1 MAG: hypothetical protein AUK01_08475 [Anaerolineae bacterium CG2_30_57_67]PJB68774.1 MAG: hypothetical protein CO094_00110 [Anaerolineae bacterium CG_4_9_14_3_um_filter_57_17]
MKTLPKWLAALLILSLTSLSCQVSLIDWNLFDQPTPIPGNNSPTATPTPLAEITFNLALPAAPTPGSAVYIAILDEVTGLALNPLIYAMQAVDAQHYSVKLPFVLNSTVKYRYVLQGPFNAQETTALGQPVRYRLIQASGPMNVDDLLASWGSVPYSGEMGGISGIVTQAESGQPLTNILVTAGGVTALTDSLGQYALRGLRPGTHWLAAYTLDGTFQPFQQGAGVNANVNTEAAIQLQPVKTVQVTFNVAVPTDTVIGAPIRLVGNLLSLGNAFADLSGGVSIIASHSPTLTPQDNHHFTLSLRLPVGTDVRYKYTLGDGFWNAEHASDDSFVVRQLIVPASDTVISDTVVTWQAGPSAPILFDVTVPANTPVGDTVSIQFNPYGWTEPLPMWPMGNNRWVYQLYGPLNMLGRFGYRYCRNEQCGAADDIATAGGEGRNVSTSLTAENLQDTVNAWKWLPVSEPASLVAVPVNPRTNGFVVGIEFQAGYHPSWQALYPSALTGVQGIGANTLIYTPTWSAIFADPLLFSPTTGRDPLWQDASQVIQYARALNFSTLIYPTPHFSPNAAGFWLNAPRTPEWWQEWFQRYRAFAVYHADLAAQGGAQGLILGGDELTPSLPGGILADGSPSNLPADAESTWRSIIKEVRAHFPGKIYWAHPYQASLAPAPAFLNEFDGIYLLWSVPLAVNGSDVDNMTAEAGRRMDEELLPFLAENHQTVILALNYPSASGAASGCVPSGAGGCLDWSALAPPNADIAAATLDLKMQADLYQAVLQALNVREWIDGFVSRGYYPPVALMDKSASIRNKTAADLLWYWYPRWLGR